MLNERFPWLLVDANSNGVLLFVLACCSSVVLLLFFCLESDSSLFCTLFLDPFDLFYGIGTVNLHCLACSFFLHICCSATCFPVSVFSIFSCFLHTCQNWNCKSALLGLFFLFASRSANGFPISAFYLFSCFLVTPFSILSFILCPCPEIGM